MKLWISRDANGTLVLSNQLPYLPNKHCDFFFYGDNASIFYLDKKMFPEITIENSPQEIELKLVNNTTNGFAEDLLTNCKPLESEFSKFVDDNFDNLI